jgi:hypothetical protein
LTGSEKDRKHVFIYHKNGLKIFASDGCISSIFNLKQNVDFFKGAYVLPIKTLKLFIDGKSDEDLAVILNSDEIILKQANELLSIHQHPVNNPPENNLFDRVGELNAHDFLFGLDFSTVHMPEDNNCYFFVFEDILYILTVYDKVFCIFNSNIRCRTLESAVPYQSLRHLIKAQGSLKSGIIKLGISIDMEKLGFQTAGLLTSICSRPLDHKEVERILRLINIYRMFKPLYRINRNSLNHNVTKAERISPGLPVAMTVNGNKINFELKSDSFYYVCTSEIEEFFSDERIIDFKFYGKYLKSALSRIKTKDVYFYTYSKYLAIGDAEKKKMIVFAADYKN